MDNLTSFNRFTSVNPNIAIHGATVEELRSVAGKPDPNPVASPMPNAAVTDVKLALSLGGSDRLRLGNPDQPSINPYEGPKLTLVLSRSAVQKLKGNVVGELAGLIQNGAVGTPELQDRMMSSLKRVGALREFMDHLNGMTEMVFAHAVGASKP